MAKAPKTPLMVIGTARKPNESDLRNRGLSGLPDPSPDVDLRRAELESEQAALRAQETVFRGESSVSFLRTNIGVDGSSNDDGSDSDQETGSRTLSEDAVLLDVDEEQIVGADITGDDEGILKPSVHVDVADLMKSPVANVEACGSQKATRHLRNRSPIQLHPYVLEREVYRRTVKAGRVE